MPCLPVTVPETKIIRMLSAFATPEGMINVRFESTYSGKAKLTVDGKFIRYIDVVKGVQTLSIKQPPGKHNVCIDPA